jgi:hypothetical protein
MTGTNKATFVMLNLFWLLDGVTWRHSTRVRTRSQLLLILSCSGRGYPDRHTAILRWSSGDWIDVTGLLHRCTLETGTSFDLCSLIPNFLS